MSKKKYLLLLIPVILIAAFIVVNYKPLSLAVEYYNETNYYNENGKINFDYIFKEVESNIANNNYHQYMLDVTDYYITSDFVYIIFDRLGLLEPYINVIRSKLIRQSLFIVIITYKFPSHYNLKVAEMLKYYPIKDIENFPELTLSFMTKISNYVPFHLFAGLGTEGAVYASTKLCRIVVAQQNCNQKEYYFNKFMYNQYTYFKNLYLGKIPMDAIDEAKLEKVNEVFEDILHIMENDIQEINNACGL